jgi:hypothetical protein
LEEGACLVVKNIGKPCAGKPQARFDEGGQGETCSLLYLESPYKKVRLTSILYTPELIELAKFYILSPELPSGKKNAEA